MIMRYFMDINQINLLYLIKVQIINIMMFIMINSHKITNLKGQIIKSKL